MAYERRHCFVANPGGECRFYAGAMCGARGATAWKPEMPKRKLISIVEDDQPFRESMRKLIGLLGYNVEAFPSAASFLASPCLTETACLVADVNMPGMTGPELHRHLDDAGHEIPTILVTAYPDEVVRKRALKDGVLCYLCKPVDDDHLERCLRSALRSDTPPQENS
jgi:FixJ family two-component response regulator